MVHSMLFTNCVKDQCYQEEEDASEQTHMYVPAETHTHKCAQQDKIASKTQKKCGPQGQPFAGLSNWRLIIQVVINIKAGDNMGRRGSQCSQASGERQNAAVSFAPIPCFSFTNTCLAQFHFPHCTLPTSLGISNKIDLAASLNFPQIPLEPGAKWGEICLCSRSLRQVENG